MANGGVNKKDSKKRSTLPPPCCHCRPVQFSCPKNGCPPFEPCIPIPRSSSPPPPFTWRTPPQEVKIIKPSLCVARPCPQRPGPIPYACRPTMKIEVPPSTVTFAIRYTCEGPTYCPCYSPGIPSCPSKQCC